MLVLFIALMITVLMVKFIYPSGDQDRVWARIAPAYYLVLSASMLLFGFIALLVPKLLFYCSFQLFWLTLCVVLLNTFHPGSGSIRFLAVMGLVIAWTSAVSLGDNAPVFSTGILFGTGFSLALNEWQKVVKATRSSLLNFQLTGAFVLTIAILSLGVYAQKRSNYRDLPSRELHFSLQAVFPEMGGVRTNQNSFEYMRDVARLYNQLGQPKDRFAVIPNGAIIYPILNSASPLPLDWMQAAEFVGQDSLVIEMMRANIKERELYFLIEKYNSKLLADSLIAARFPDKDYPYMEALVQMTRIVEQLESAFFEIRVSK